MNYETLRRVQEALNLIYSGEIDNFEVGKHTINDYMYVNSQEYQSKTEAAFESHKKYIDIQYVKEGEEIINIAPASELIVDKEYNEAKDVTLGTVKESYKVVVGPKQYRILYPEEAHQPGMAVTTPAPVKKVIIKVLIAQ
ncbi:MAG: YhcH/YjgK/YiaL family protein [Clostridia bacterium]|nr:YhcH/YjgK/YiaL family protein [Clostridia bacterium]